MRPEFSRVLWLDPGKLTGWAVLRDGKHFSSGQADFYSIGLMLESMCNVHGPRLAVGYEDFIVTSTGSQYSDPDYSLKVIGMVDWLVQRHKAVSLPKMPSSARKLGMDGGKLQKLGWYTPGQGHANDAAAHLLSWLLREHRLSAGHLADLFTTEAGDGKIDQ